MRISDWSSDVCSPDLAVAGLNPHAGEGGALGREEIEIIIPAIKQLRDDGCDVGGPYPADALFHERARRSYDAALCMYHDQALVPLKTLHFDEGVNMTPGIPIRSEERLVGKECVSTSRYRVAPDP